MNRLPCCSNSSGDSLSTIRPLCDVEVSPEEVVEAPREQEYGVRNPRKLLDPKLPTQLEVG